MGQTLRVRRSFTIYRSNRGDLRTNQLSGVGIFATITVEEREETLLKAFLHAAGYSSGRSRLTLTGDVLTRLRERGLAGMPETILFHGHRLKLVHDRGNPHAIVPKRLAQELGIEKGDKLAAYFDVPAGTHRGPALQRLMRATPRLVRLFNTGPFAGYWDGFPGEEETAEAEEPMPGVTLRDLKRRPRWEVLVVRGGGNTADGDEGAKRADGAVLREEQHATTFRVDHDNLEASGKRYPVGYTKRVTGA